VPNSKYTSASEPLLECCRKFAVEGNFVQLADSVSEWFRKSPESKSFIRNRVPAIIVNSYFVKLEILSFQQFVEWEKENDWAEMIKNNVENSLSLPSIVENIVLSMKKFSVNNA